MIVHVTSFFLPFSPLVVFKEHQTIDPGTSNLEQFHKEDNQSCDTGSSNHVDCRVDRHIVCVYMRSCEMLTVGSIQHSCCS